MQIGPDGKAAFRTSTRMITETAFVSGDHLCEQSESVFGRADCGPVYRRPATAGEADYAYVNSGKVFYFSPIR